MSREVTFKLAGAHAPLILVPTFVNGQGPYDFVLDTGASATLLSPELAERLGLTATSERSETVRRVHRQKGA
jgi:predicted aspartyl protease